MYMETISKSCVAFFLYILRICISFLFNINYFQKSILSWNFFFNLYFTVNANR